MSFSGSLAYARGRLQQERSQQGSWRIALHSAASAAQAVSLAATHHSCSFFIPGPGFLGVVSTDGGSACGRAAGGGLALSGCTGRMRKAARYRRAQRAAHAGHATACGRMQQRAAAGAGSLRQHAAHAAAGCSHLVDGRQPLEIVDAHLQAGVQVAHGEALLRAGRAGGAQAFGTLHKRERRCAARVARRRPACGPDCGAPWLHGAVRPGQTACQNFQPLPYAALLPQEAIRAAR